VTQKSAGLKKVHDLLPDFAPIQVITEFEETVSAAVHAMFRSKGVVPR